MLENFSRAAGRLVGWRVVTTQPLPDRCVLIGAPHTSGWDVPALFLLMGATGVRLRYLAKDALFNRPLGWFFKATGGIPVNRSKSENMVAHIVAQFKQTAHLRLALSPEGTRHHTPYWRTGFYHIALGAEVPIVMGFADYLRRVVGWGPMIYPTGDIRGDFEHIKAFYQNIIGKNPHKQGPLQLRP